MTFIYASTHFNVVSAEPPHVDRNDGGHIVISPKVRVSSKAHLAPHQLIELIRLDTLVGQAMITVMNRHGVDVGRINSQDNGNWGVDIPEGPSLHIHIYGRAKSAKIQQWGHALYLPHKRDHPAFYHQLKPLSSEDVADIQQEIQRLLTEEKYVDTHWRL